MVEHDELTLQDVQIPTKDVDSDEMLADRLTNNVQHNIGPNRYFVKDENGDPTEDWDGVFERVAKSVAIAEAVFHDLPLSVNKDQLAEWVDKETRVELLGADDTVGTPSRVVDEEIAPYLDYDALLERAPDEISEDMAAKREEFESAMRELRFIPNSPTLMNAGTELQQLSACFVVHPGDAMTGEAPHDESSIMRANEEAADIFKSGGGVGYPFHLLRPKGARISSTSGVSSGPMSFMEVYNTTCGTVQQGGRRRGAQMGIMHSQHPDIGRFCVAKRGEENLSNFNISVGITDEFLDAVENDEMYTLVDPEERYIDPEPFNVVVETAHFYDPKFEDTWNDEYDKPGLGYDSKKVEDNFWRDHQEEMQDPEAFEAFRDRISLEPGEPMELPARFIWNLLVDGAHNKGEPGFVNLDEINRMHTYDVEEHPEHVIHGTNPCVTGETLIYTDSGPIKAEELYQKGTSTGVVVDSRLSDESTKEASSVYKTGEKEVYELTTEEGYNLRLTKDHRVKTDDGWVEAGDLSAGDTVHILDREGEFGEHGSAELGSVIGWLVGDGHLKHGEERAVLNFYDDDCEISEEMAEKVNEIIRDPTGHANYEVDVSDIRRPNQHRGTEAMEQRVRSTRLYEIADDLGLTSEKLQVPETIQQSSRECAREFLRALFGAAGSVQGTASNGTSVRLGTCSLELANDVQRLLQNFGIRSKIYNDRELSDTSLMPDNQGGRKEYETQSRHEVCIAADAMERFNEKIGFSLPQKNEQLESLLNSYTKGPYSKPFKATVESIERDGVEAVYDLTEPDTESFVANGVVVHNCSEQPLANYEACNLGHVNLSLMVDPEAEQYNAWELDEIPDFEDYSQEWEIDQFLDHALDQELFEETTRTAANFLENVVTMSKFPLEKIEETVHNNRKIGVGLMGFHQMLLQMGIEYGSETSYIVAEKIMERIDDYAVTESHELAKQRGPFPNYEDSKWAQPAEYPEWFEQYGHRDPDKQKGGEFIIRNHNCTTIAPTGTTSMIGNTTGGCEPMYNVAYFKNVGDDIQGDEMLVEFDDLFLRTLEANDLDVDAVKEEAKSLMMDNDFDGVDDLETVPEAIGELFVTTEDLDVEQHIYIQAGFQKHCHSAISKCVQEGTIIQTDDGPRRVEDLGDASQPNEFAEATNTTVNGNEVTDHYYDGISSATRVHLENKPDLVAGSENHRVRTTDGWKEISELEEGDHVVGEFTTGHGAGRESIVWEDEFNNNAEEIETPDEMTPELASIIGMMAADGHLVESTGEVGISTSNERIGEEFSQSMEHIFGVDVHERPDTRNSVVTYCVNSKNLYRFFESMMGSGARDKHVPEQILAGSELEKRAFVEGLTLDGYINQGSLVVYEGMSEQLAYETHALLQSFGLPYVSYESKYVNETDSYAYSVRVSNQLQEKISPFEAHKNVDAHYRDFKVYVDTGRLRSEMTDNDEIHYSDPEYRTVANADRQDRDHMFKTSATNAGIEQDDLQPVYRVKGTSDAGQEPLYDIEVQDSHQYTANGIVNHNTLNVENDATLEETGDAIKLALEEGIKGATIYRIDSRSEEVLTTNVSGGGVPVPEADNEMLIDELFDRFGGDTDQLVVRNVENEDETSLIESIKENGEQLKQQVGGEQ